MTESSSVIAAQASLGAAGRPVWRDRLFGVAAMVFAGSVVLFTVGRLLQLIDALQSHALVGFSVGTGFGLLSPLLAIPAFVLASVAFLLAPQRRTSQLAGAASILAASFLSSFVAYVILASVAGTHDAADKVIAGFSAEAVSDLALVLALILVAGAYLLVVSEGLTALPRRDGLLGSSSIALGVSYAFAMTSAILFLVLYSDFGATGGYTAGLGMAAGGAGVAIIASGIAAASFFVSAARQRRASTTWLAGRDLTLGIAAAVFAVAFLVSAIGYIVIAAADPRNGVTGKEAAADWLAAIGELGLMLGAACACAGFFLSRIRR